MKIAVPIADGLLCPHFGHCEQFAIYEVNTSTNEIIDTEFLNPPAHEPGVLPRWLSEKGASTVIAGGMGNRAQQFFAQYGVSVVVGAHVGDPQSIVEAYLKGSLVPGDNLCDH